MQSFLTNDYKVNLMKKNSYPKLYPEKGTKERHYSFCLYCGKNLIVSSTTGYSFFPCCRKFIEGSTAFVKISDLHIRNYDDYNLAYYIRYTSNLCNKSGADFLLDLSIFQNHLYDYNDELLKIEDHLLRQKKVDEIVSKLEIEIASREARNRLNRKIDSFISKLEHDSSIFRKLNKDRLKHWNSIVKELTDYAEKIRDYEDSNDGLSAIEYLDKFYETDRKDNVFYGYKNIFTDDRFDNMWLPYEKYIGSSYKFCCINCGSYFSYLENEDFKYKLCLNCYKLSKNNLREFNSVSYKFSNLQERLLFLNHPINTKWDMHKIKKTFKKYGEYSIYDTYSVIEDGYEFIYYLIVFNSIPDTIFIMQEKVTEYWLRIISYKTLLLESSDDTLKWFENIIKFVIRDMPYVNEYFILNVQINNVDYNQNPYNY